MKKFWKILIIAGILAVLSVIGAVVVNVIVKRSGVVHNSSGDVDNVRSAVIVLGARVYDDGVLSAMLEDRVKVALALYADGKVEKFLLSGDHGREDYDEVNAMKAYLLERGVPAEDIFLDHAGFDTYDSIYRAKKVFEVDSTYIVSQGFHLPRALYIARSEGIEAEGVSADLQPYVETKRLEQREILARMKAFLDVILKSKPKYLGDPIPITGDGQFSWD